MLSLALYDIFYNMLDSPLHSLEAALYLSESFVELLRVVVLQPHRIVPVHVRNLLFDRPIGLYGVVGVH